MSQQYWLMKSEPKTYSIDQLAKEGFAWWEGVRNYQARNFMKEMKVGDGVLFYHSNAEPSGVVGVARVSKGAEPDASQFNRRSGYFDNKASKDKPIWFCTQIQFEKKFKKIISLNDLRQEKSLSNMLVLKKGQRLSVQPVTEQEFRMVLALGFD